ncbi:MAG: tail-specific protease [Planctomycetaceae bacterium]|nr:MAG: tail-specific protease [Planctomycetaceae bacterium]
MRISGSWSARRRAPVGIALVALLTVPFVWTAGAQDRTVAPPAAAPAAGLKQGDQDSLVSRLVMQLLPKRHISGRKVDDEISARALNNFLKSLDPMKLYFTQGDIDEFAKYKDQIDDLTLRGDLSPAYAIFTRYLVRVNERLLLAQSLLEGDFDFTTAETIISDPKSTTYVRSDDEALDRWRRQLKFNILDLKDDGKTIDEARDQLKRRYARYARRWAQTDSDEILELYLSSITMAYDPHTTYMSPSSLNDFNIQMRLNLEGIGAALREKDGYTVVSNVIPGGAAARDGRLGEDDHIVSVGQSLDGEMVDIVEMPLKQVVSMIRGKAGTVVRLGVKKGGAGETEVYEITRAQVQLEDSAARGKVIEHPSPDGGPALKIGYINLPSFYLDMEGARRNTADFRSSTRDVRRLLDGFRADGVDGVVLDLSRNGGGSLTESINLTGLFIDRGPVVQVKDSSGAVQDYADEEAGVAWDGPLVVMTSKLSASASEILAGAIKDYRRGIIVGDPTTHGKGTVQTLMDLGREMFRHDRTNFGALKVTLQQFYLPGGDSTQLNGVAADVILPSITSVMDISESDLDFALPHDRVAAVRHQDYNMVPANLLETLRDASTDRVGADKEFLDLLRRKDLYVSQKQEKTISLLEEDFVARRKQLDAQKEEEKEGLEEELGNDIVYRDTYYNREVMNIAHDYIRGLRDQNLATASVNGRR